MIPLLGSRDPFPSVDRALDEPNGLLAAGATLDLDRLIDAYSRGIFPWFSDGDPILWWSPDPRMVLETNAFRISRSLRRRLRRADYSVTIDRTFRAVLEACAAPRPEQDGTWLTKAMMQAYERLHRAGLAHSVEVWMDDHLAGGLYGVALGRMFFGESMFSRRTDGSKIALAYLTAQLRDWHFPLVDCQMQTSHLASLGAIEVTRRSFVRTVARLVEEPGREGLWSFDPSISVRFRQSADEAAQSADPIAADRSRDRS